MVQYISFHCGKFNQTFPSTQFDKTLLICTNYFVSHRKIADIPLLCLTMRQLRVINEMRTDKVDRYLSNIVQRQETVYIKLFIMIKQYCIQHDNISFYIGAETVAHYCWCRDHKIL